MTMSDRDELSAPLLGCLYCHAEGTITEVSPRRLFGFGADYPQLRCSHCGAVALFDDNLLSGEWRINYRKFSREATYYFSALNLGQQEWLSAEEALQISTKAYIQRERLQQARRGDLSWLRPRASLPPSISPTEQLLFLNKQGVLYDSQDMKVDTGVLYWTAGKLYLLGQAQQWEFDLQQVQHTDYSEHGWELYLSSSEREYLLRCDYRDDEIDPQLTTAIIETLMQQVGGN